MKNKYQMAWKTRRANLRKEKLAKLINNVKLVTKWSLPMLAIASIMALGAFYKPAPQNAQAKDVATTTASTTDIIVKLPIAKYKENLSVAELKNIYKPLGVKYAFMNGNWKGDKLEKRINTELRIREITDKINPKYTDYIIRLSDCESYLGLTLINNQNNHPETSQDEGFLMWNNYWQKNINEKCSFDLACEIKEVVKKIEAGQQGLWMCDKIVRNKEIFR